MTSTSTPHPAIRIGPSMDAPLSSIARIAPRRAAMPRSRTAVTTIDGVIGSPSVDRCDAGSDHCGAACPRRPVFHRPRKASHGARKTAGPHTTDTMMTAQRIMSMGNMTGPMTCAGSCSAMARTVPRASRPPAVVAVPTSAPLAMRCGALSRSMRRWWRAARN